MGIGNLQVTFDRSRPTALPERDHWGTERLYEFGDLARELDMAVPVIDIDFLDDRNFATTPFRAGDTIFSEGDVEPLAYIVRSGEVEIRAGDHVLERVEPGSIFGEMALVDGSKRSANAVAAADTELIGLDRRALLDLIGAQPYFALNVLRVMCVRIRREDRRLYG